MTNEAEGLDLDALEKVAREAYVPRIRWCQDHAPTDEVLAVDEVSKGVAVVAKVNPMAEWTGATAVSWGAHIATFDPHTVLRLFAALRAQAERVRVLEGENERAKAFINGDLKASFIQQADAVAENLPWKVKAIDALARAEAAERRAGELEGALQLASDTITATIEVAEQARQEWDAAPQGMKAGKLLIALCDPSMRYRLDITLIHANRTKIAALLPATQAEEEK